MTLPFCRCIIILAFRKIRKVGLNNLKLSLNPLDGTVSFLAFFMQLNDVE